VIGVAYQHMTIVFRLCRPVTGYKSIDSSVVNFFQFVALVLVIDLYETGEFF
jgi:hypothetical protein